MMASDFELPGEGEGAWDERIRLALPRVYRYLFFKVGDRGLAEDLAADTFERAWRDRHRYRPERGEWGMWVLGIARHVAAGFLRRHRAVLPIDCADADSEDRPTEEDADRRAEVTRMGKLLCELRDRDRDLVGLKYGAGMTNRAIARLTGLSETNVGTIIYRAVSRLRRRWEEKP
jgi:RNA polymerase sigma-70 factor (ECF subfamily)